MKTTRFLLMVFFAMLSIGLCACEKEDEPSNDPGNGGSGSDNPGGGTAQVGGFDSNGASNALFSVSASEKVQFSRGNLQYKASTGTWRFAESQLDIVGDANSNISSSYSGWIDLFGWGTSGWNSGVEAYMPYSSSPDFQHYLRNVDIVGSYAEADWGWHNAISNGGNQTHLWRTMTVSEWEYLLGTSGNRAGKWGLATIGSTRGLIILPDNWTTPSGLTWKAANGSYSYYDDNVYTTSQWNQMESAGAIFLPAAGDREGDAVYNTNNSGNYWSSSHDPETDSYSFRGVHFHDGSVFCPSGDSPRIGYSVRLVKAISGGGTPNPTTSQGGFDANGASNALFSVSSGKTIHFSRGNLQYQASTGTWRFAEAQVDFVGDANTNISSSYSGWIDLFGWGTSGWNSGVEAYMPYSSSLDFQHYLRNVDIVGSYAEADWGWHNAISNGGNQTHLWRTMTVSEWEYLLGTSGNRAGKWGLATVGGTKGLVILPDSWTIPAGLTWTAANGSYGYYDDNTYTTSQWNQMEGAGAIFLPAAGDREGDAVYNTNNSGNYWSSSHDSETDSYTFRGVHFHDGAIWCPSGDSPRIGYSVRLVKE